ncbi:hypothetical protein [Massilia sp. TSP1-1-2]|uniref:hypothetical protein n=1 Tax=unclassified Massilia TaxID=2609279 RepID=UPI003CF2F84B
MKNRMMVAVLCMAAMTGASAEIRKMTGADGKVTLSNVPLVLKNPATQAPRPVVARLPEAGSDLLRPEVIGAVANVMGITHLVSSSREFCVATTPTSYKRYSSAADAWLQRNAAVVAHKEKVMATGDQRLVANALSGDMVRQTEEMMRPVRGAGTAEKVAWCDKAFADVNRGALDLVGRASIAPLMRYHPR